MDSLAQLRKLAAQTVFPMSLRQQALYDEEGNYITHRELLDMDDLDQPIQFSSLETSDELRGMVAGYALIKLIHSGYAFSLVFQNMEYQIDPYQMELLPNMFVTSGRDFLDVVLKAWAATGDGL